MCCANPVRVIKALKMVLLPRYIRENKKQTRRLG